MQTIANFLSCINNAQKQYQHFLKYQESKFIIGLLNLFMREKIIRGFFFDKSQKFVCILLKYGLDQQIFYKLNYISNKKTRKLFLKRLHNGLGVFVISTCFGLLNNQQVLKLGLGGKLLLKIF